MKDFSMTVSELIEEISSLKQRIKELEQSEAERARTEGALRESQEKFKEIFETIEDLYYETDRDGIIRILSPSVRRLTGWTEEDLIGKPATMVYVDPDHRQQLLSKVSEKGYVHDYEVLLKKKDGEVRLASLSARFIVDDGGRPTGMRGILRDITERKRTTEALQLNAQRTEALLHLNQMAGSSLQEITNYALEEAVRLTRSALGYLAFLNEDESVMTMHSWSRTAVAECAIAEKPIRYRVAETGLWGEAVRQRKPVITNDYSAPSLQKKGYPKGHVQISRHMNVPVFAENRIVLVAGVGNKEEEYNLSDAQQLTVLMEGMWRLIERMRADEEIAGERSKLKTLSDNAPFGMVLIDGDGRFTYINNRFTELFGFDLSEIPDGRTWFRKAYPDSEYRQTVISTWREDLGDANPGERKARVFTVTCKDGTRKIVQFIPSILVSGGYLMTCEDITELRKLESQLRQAQKMEAIGTLAGGVAHDFNNILTSLLGYSSLVQMKMDKENPLRPYVDQVVMASQKAGELTRSLLAFSRQQPVTLIPLDMNDTIKVTKELLKRLLPEDIELTTSFAKDDTIVLADKSQIDQILFNLVANARDAMPKGGILAIKTGIASMNTDFVRAHGFGEPGRYVLITVSDTGTGMDEATREHIFDPFFTTKETGKGTGLGLPTVYGIVKQHSGYITVDSEPNRGTVLSIYLPAVKAMVDQEEREAAAVERGKETVLIAEDNEGVRRFIRDLLQQHGYRTIEAVDGEDAIERFTQHPGIDLVVIDSVMPKKNGREVYEAIIMAQPNTRVIFTSGYTKDIVLDKGIEDKEFDFIAKPLSPTAFLQKVREVLDR